MRLSAWLRLYHAPEALALAVELDAGLEPGYIGVPDIRPRVHKEGRLLEAGKRNAGCLAAVGRNSWETRMVALSPLLEPYTHPATGAPLLSLDLERHRRSRAPIDIVLRARRRAPPIGSAVRLDEDLARL